VGPSLLRACVRLASERREASSGSPRVARCAVLFPLLVLKHASRVLGPFCSVTRRMLYSPWLRLMETAHP